MFFFLNDGWVCYWWEDSFLHVSIYRSRLLSNVTRSFAPGWWQWFTSGFCAWVLRRVSGMIANVVGCMYVYIYILLYVNYMFIVAYINANKNIYILYLMHLVTLNPDLTGPHCFQQVQVPFWGFGEITPAIFRDFPGWVNYMFRYTPSKTNMTFFFIHCLKMYFPIDKWESSKKSC